MSISENNSNGRVTFKEARQLAIWMGAFTARELAEGLHVHEDVGEHFCIALSWEGHPHGPIVQDSGCEIDGPDGPEILYEYVEPPDTIYPRNKHTPPEVMAVIEMYGGFLLYNRRGVAVRLQHQGKKGHIMSTPGARQQQKLRDLAWRRMQDAIRRRQEQQRRRWIAMTQGKRYFESGPSEGSDGDGGAKKGKKAGRRTK